MRSFKAFLSEVLKREVQQSLHLISVKHVTDVPVLGYSLCEDELLRVLEYSLCEYKLVFESEPCILGSGEFLCDVLH